MWHTGAGRVGGARARHSPFILEGRLGLFMTTSTVVASFPYHFAAFFMEAKLQKRPVCSCVREFFWEAPLGLCSPQAGDKKVESVLTPALADSATWWV